MKTAQFVLLLLGIIGMLLFFSCEIDHGLEPIRSGFSGTIYYRNAWPDSLTEVRLVTTNVSFDELLAAISVGDVSKLMFSEPLPTKVDSSQYTFWVQPDTYTAVVLAGKKPSESWSEQSILAVYGNILFPKPVHVAESDKVVRNVDLIAKFK